MNHGSQIFFDIGALFYVSTCPKEGKSALGGKIEKT